MKVLLATITLSAAVIVLAACQSSPTTNTPNASNASQSPKANSTVDMNGMNHNTMPMNSSQGTSGMMDQMKSDPDAASQPYDLQFIDSMTAHHQSAIEMAQLALSNTQNDKLRTFAQKIIDDQKKEIGQLTEWREKWFVGKPPAKNMDMPGMRDSMGMMMPDEMKNLKAATGKDFDLMFLDMMIRHHDGAIAMAKDAPQRAERAEIKALAGQVIKAQESENKQMQAWKSEWSK